MIPVAFVMSVAVAATHVRALSWHDFGPLGTAAILLPVWLLGCLLAEEVDTLPALAIGEQWRIWMWRFGVWFASWITEMLHFKAHLPLTQTMAWFGVIAYFWVKNEIAWSKTHRHRGCWLGLGLWSYSLYLVHVQAAGLWYWPRAYWLSGVSVGPRLNWFAVILSSLVGAYIFYLVVERPSHRLARWIASTRSAAVSRESAPSVTVDAPLPRRA